MFNLNVVCRKKKVGKRLLVACGIEDQNRIEISCLMTSYSDMEQFKNGFRFMVRLLQ